MLKINAVRQDLFVRIFLFFSFYSSTEVGFLFWCILVEYYCCSISISGFGSIFVTFKHWNLFLCHAFKSAKMKIINFIYCWSYLTFKFATDLPHFLNYYLPFFRIFQTNKTFYFRKVLLLDFGISCSFRFSNIAFELWQCKFNKTPTKSWVQVNGSLIFDTLAANVETFDEGKV